MPLGISAIEGFTLTGSGRLFTWSALMPPIPDVQYWELDPPRPYPLVLLYEIRWSDITPGVARLYIERCANQASDFEVLLDSGRSQDLFLIANESARARVRYQTAGTEYLSLVVSALGFETLEDYARFKHMVGIS